MTSGASSDAAWSVREALAIDWKQTGRMAKAANSLRHPKVRKRVENMGVSEQALAALAAVSPLGELADPVLQHYGLRPVPKYQLIIANGRETRARVIAVVQAAVKDWLQRRATLGLKMQIALADVDRRANAKNRIWRAYRAALSRRRITALQAASAQALQRRLLEHKCSRKIGKVVRGFLARRRVSRMAATLRKRKLEERMRIMAASLSIQRIVRGKIARVKVKRIKRALFAAAMVLQKIVRGVKARRRLRLYLEKSGPAASTLQFWFRNYLLRKGAKEEVARRMAIKYRVSATVIGRTLLVSMFGTDLCALVSRLPRCTMRQPTLSALHVALWVDDGRSSVGCTGAWPQFKSKPGFVRSMGVSGSCSAERRPSMPSSPYRYQLCFIDVPHNHLPMRIN